MVAAVPRGDRPVDSRRTIHRSGRGLLPTPLACCAEQVDDNVRLASALRSEGHGYDGLARMVRAGELVKVRHGAYATEQPDDPAAVHRRLVAATLPRCGDVCLSHASAALLHGLPSWPADLGRVQVTKSRTSGGRRSKVLHVHVAPLRPEEVVTIDGFAVTTGGTWASTPASSGSSGFGGGGFSGGGGGGGGGGSW